MKYLITMQISEGIQAELLPKQLARVKIDERLAKGGWHVCDRGRSASGHDAVVVVTLGKLPKGIEV